MQKIKAIREALNLKQSEFSAALDISQTYLSAIETGRRQFTSKLANILFKKFNVSPEWLYNDNGNIFNSTMGNTDGVNSGVNHSKIQEHGEYSGFKDSPKVANVILFWDLVRERDNGLIKIWDEVRDLQPLKTDTNRIITLYIDNIYDLADKILSDVQSVDNKELVSLGFMEKSIKKLSLLRDQLNIINTFKTNIESLLTSTNHDSTALVIGGNSKGN